MSDTPRNDDSPEYRDPTAPSDSGSSRHSSSSKDHTSPIETNETQPVPPVPPAPGTPAGPVGPEPGYGPPPPGSPPMSAPGAGQPNHPGPQYPTQGQVHQAGYPGAPGYGPPGYGAPGYGAPGYGGPAYGAPQSLSGSTIALLVVSGLTTLGCGFGIVALIFAIIAATKKDEPADAAKFTRWGWIALVVGFVLTVLVIVAVGVLFAVGSNTGSSFDTGY